MATPGAAALVMAGNGEKSSPGIDYRDRERVEHTIQKRPWTEPTAANGAKFTSPG